MSFSVSRPLPLSAMPAVVLLTPEEAHEIDATRAIFRDYAASLGIDLDFQDFEGELATLPGDYADPRGTLLLALVDPANVNEEAGRQAPTLRRTDGTLAHVAGCCALRPLDNADYANAAEMKRLYVRRGFRGLGLGRQLAEAILMPPAARATAACCWTPSTTWNRRGRSTKTWASSRSRPTITTPLPGPTTSRWTCSPPGLRALRAARPPPPRAGRPLVAAVRGGPPENVRTQPRAWASSVSASLTSNLPGASTFSVATLPSFTSIE